MSILCIYNEEPKFPATDQHPNAERFHVGPYIVDALGDAPTVVQIEEVLGLRGNAPILSKLEDIDVQTMKGVRGLREFILAQAQLTDYLIAHAVVPGSPISGNVGIKNIRDLEAAAVALRAQLT